MTNTPLVCPHCGTTEIRSDEAAVIGYPVHLFRNSGGEVEVDYTGESYQVFDEGTVYDGKDLWCENGHNITESELVTAAEVDA